VEIEVEEYEARHAGTFSHIVDTIRLPGSWWQRQGAVLDWPAALCYA
jgi:hypothetical protein